ncbi:hypothetical protein SAMN05216323_102047 [Williamwhitmania taraxaci]|uniref:Uncharacterized protein n=1 Tax=Williamwhitmania taraxaci TaxID=1640674 RepID=A0A1G6JKJ7_9BACT|nr:hypothetical protein SAMN05216323_102047 [Williamwhitmania taraxaci]
MLESFNLLEFFLGEDVGNKKKLLPLPNFKREI